MHCIEPAMDHVEVTRDGRYIEVTTPTVEISCHLPLGCAVRGHDIQVRFHRLPVQCDMTASELLRDAYIGLGTLPSDQTRPFLYQYDESRWQVRVGGTRVNLYTDEVRDMCSCLDVIGYHYATSLREATSLLELWNYPQAEVRGKTGVQLLMVHMNMWHLMQRYAQEFNFRKGETEWHCFGDLHSGDAITIRKAGGPIWATLWSMPHETYNGVDYLPLLYEYPDATLLEQEEMSALPWQFLSKSGVWTASFTQQWLTDTLIPQALSHYHISSCTESGISTSRICNVFAQVFAPHVFEVYRKHFDIHPAAYATETDHLVPLDAVEQPSDLIPYINELHQWFGAYPVSRMAATLLQPYYAVIAAFVKCSHPSLVSPSALSTFFEHREDDLNAEPKSNGWRLLNTSFEAFSARVIEQARRVRECDYEDVTCADLISQAFLHLLHYGRHQATEALLQQAVQAVKPLWEQARFDKRYVLTHGTAERFRVHFHAAECGISPVRRTSL